MLQDEGGNGRDVVEIQLRQARIQHDVTEYGHDRVVVGIKQGFARGGAMQLQFGKAFMAKALD